MNLVRKIIEEVKKNGDKAVRKYTAIFDGIKIKDFRVSKKEIKQAYQQVDKTAQFINKEGVKKLAKTAIKFAALEDLDAHKESAKIRLEQSNLK